MARKKRLDLNKPEQVQKAVMQAMTLKALQGDTRAAKIVLDEIAKQSSGDQIERVIIIDDIPAITDKERED